MDMLMYLQKTQDGEMLSCRKCEATHARLPKVTYEALSKGEYLNVTQKTHAARRERSELESILDIINTALQRCYEESDAMDTNLMMADKLLEEKR